MRNSHGEPYGGEERIAGDGSVLITRSELALLQGLLDRPHGTAHSYGDWIRAAIPYLTIASPRAYSNLTIRGKYSIPMNWASRTREGSRVVVELEPRGRDILELKVPCRIRGYGIYRGFRALRSAFHD